MPKKKQHDEQVALNIRCFSREERQQFKAWCAARDITMELAAVRILMAAVDGILDKNEVKVLIEPLTLTKN